MGNACSNSSANAEVEAVQVTAPAVKEKEEPKPAVVEKELVIKVYACRGLRNADWTWIPGQGVSDAYVVCKAGGKQLLKTNCIENSLEPIFDQEFECRHDVSEPLDFVVYDHDPAKPDDVLGKATLTPENFAADGYNGELELTGAGEGMRSYLKLMIKEQGKEYPKGPATQFDVTVVTRDSGTEKVFEVETTDPSVLFIAKIPQTGPVAEHNATADVYSQLKVGQYIAAVNGVSTNAKDMEKQLAGIEKVELTVRRPIQFTVSVEGGKMGLDLTIDKTSLLVKKVLVGWKGGKAEAWNKQYPNKQIETFDRIVAVNGKKGTGDELFQHLRKDKKLNLAMSRVSPDPNSAAVKMQATMHWFMELF